MSVEGIISRIKQDALAEAERIKQKYLEQIRQIEQEFEGHRQEVLAQAEQRARRERETAHQRAIDRARSELSKKLLAHKRELLDKFYARVREKIENMPPEEYRRFFARVLASLGERDGEISVGADSDVLDEEFLSEAERIIGEKCSFNLKKTEQNFRGFVLTKGKIRYDATLESVLEFLREKTEEKVIKELFG